MLILKKQRHYRYILQGCHSLDLLWTWQMEGAPSKGQACCACLQIFIHAQVGWLLNKCRSKMQREVSLAGARKKCTTFTCSCAEVFVEIFRRHAGGRELWNSSSPVPCPRQDCQKVLRVSAYYPQITEQVSTVFAGPFPSPAVRSILLPVHK